jgi:hypothetical protein
MHQERTKKWIEALRSGEYEQTTGELRTWDPEKQGYRFCCLGVLCELYRQSPEAEANVTFTGWETNTSRFIARDDVEDGTLPIPVQEWIGMDSGDPDIYDEFFDYVSIVDLNDSRRYTFPVIAGLLETTLELDGALHVEHSKEEPCPDA